MSDEEKKAIEIVKGITEDDLLNYWEGPEEPYNAIQTILNLIEKQSKEIEELKENNKKLTDEYLIQRDLINLDFLKDYIIKEKSEQKRERLI